MSQNGVNANSELTAGQNVPEHVLAFVRQSPISMWVADSTGTLVVENEASRKLFGLSSDDTLVGKYNIFKDEEIINLGQAPGIRRVFEEGTPTQFVIDYQFSYVQHILSAHPTRAALRIFIFTLRDGTQAGQHAIVQHDDYTEHWRSDKSLAESEAHYRRIVEHIFDWIWVIDPDGRLFYSNPVAESVFGQPTEDILGRSILDFVDEQERDHVRELLHRGATEKAKISQVPMRIHRSDGSTRYLEARGEPILDEHNNLIGYRGIAVDLTESHIAEEAVRRSEGKFRTIFDHVPAAIYVFDQDGIILQANAACERLFGLAPESLLGLPIVGVLVRPEESERVQDIIAKVFSGEIVKDEEWQIQRPEGSLMVVLANIVPLYDNLGKPIWGIGLHVDVTERKLQEQRKLELEENKRQFYRSTIFAATDGKLIITNQEEIEKTAGSSIASWDVGRPEEVTIVRSGIKEAAKSAGMAESKIDDLALCVGELVTNVIKHAERGKASLRQLPGALLFVCEDHGPGINTMTLPQATLQKGYSTARSLGMGYKEVIQLADKVSLATGPEGTIVAVEVKLQPEEVSPQAQALLDRW